MLGNSKGLHSRRRHAAPPPPGLSVIVLVLPLPASVDLTPPPLYERLASSADCSEDGLV